MLVRGPILEKGDVIALISPAKVIELPFVEYAVTFFEQAGFRVKVGKHALNQFGYFAGTDEERAADLQEAIDDPEVKAIICNRGGYGAVRLFDRVNWANLLREPKWLAGFSDITNFHCFALKLGVESIHATMPLNFQENTPEALNSLLKILTGEPNRYSWDANPSNHTGLAEAEVVGGNLSILYAHLGTPFCPDYEHKMLVIEDLGEQYYHLDRMLWAFRQAGVFEKIAGLLIGGVTDMKDTAQPTGFTLEQLIREHLVYRSIPIAFGAPVGHLPDNRAIIIGRKAHLEITDSGVTFSQ